MVLGIVGIDPKFLILMLQNIIVGFLNTQSLQLIFHMNGLAFLFQLMLIGDKQQNGGYHMQNTGNRQAELNIQRKARLCHDVPKENQTNGTGYRI